MRAAAFLCDLRSRGVRIEVQDGRLRVEAEPGVLKPDDGPRLAKHKPALVALLSGRANPAPSPPPQTPEPSQSLREPELFALAGCGKTRDRVDPEATLC